MCTRPQSAWHLPRHPQRKSQRFYWYAHHFVRHRGQSPRTRRKPCNSGGWPGGRIVTNRRVPRNRNNCAVARDSPRSRRHRGNDVGRGRQKWARYGPEVHGTFCANPRDFIGMRIILCGTGDSSRGHGGSRATAAVGRAVESSQTEESPETATTVPLPGTVPAVADTGEMMGAAAGKKGLVTALRCMAPATTVAWHLQRRHFSSTPP